jgi:hypothetical protein
MYLSIRSPAYFLNYWTNLNGTLFVIVVYIKIDKI